MNIFAPRTCAYTLMVLNTALAAAVLTIELSKWIVIPIGALLLPCCYLVIRFAYRHTDCASACMTEIYEHLAMGAFMITSALAITLTNVTGITPGDMGPRVTGAMLGMLIVFFGNRLPKQSVSKSCPTDRAIVAQRIHRRAGYVMVFAGILMVASWIVFPQDIAEPVFLVVGILMTLVVLALSLELRTTRSHA